MLIIDTVIEQTSLKESANQVTDAFPFRTACSDIRYYPCRQFPWHWHEDIELLYVTAGKLLVKLPDQQIILSEGDVIFIPSNILHATSTVDDFPGVHKEYIFSPLFLGGSWNSVLMQKYILPLINNDSNYLIVKQGDSQNARLQELLTEIQDLAKDEAENYEFLIHQLLEAAWMLLLGTAKQTAKPAPMNRSNQDRLYKMLEYIQNHYNEPITLEDIANTAQISTRECNRCFKNMIHVTTMDYLLEYRITQACTELTGSHTSITEIGYNCGFSSASYFTKRFREQTGMTPKEYRKKG